MARQSIFSTDTVLYHPLEGAKTFPAGEQDPGPAWSENPGGPLVGGPSVKQSAADLIAAQDQIDGLGEQINRLGASLADVSKERDDAVGRTSALEAEANAANQAREAAEAAAAELTGERDQARSVEADLRAAITKLEGDLTGVSKARDEANENAALYAEEVQKLGDRVKELEADVAKVDGDGDGKVGGRKSKPAEPA